ncbi:helix-turn-helix domain-containing protein [Parvularcula oceani]|uniref:helix-turn-helix domain-containing protein n=1 Tax=Parvularcula oceani TaxID=1247963 RepID=UPI0009DF7863|nr:helix-turn-helix domain-containing protein [Parvularcula oceani]
MSVLKRYERGEEIYAQGSKGGRLPKVCSGAAIIYALLEDGRRQIVDLAGPGDFLHFEFDGELDHAAEALCGTEIVEVSGDSAFSDPDLCALLVEQMRMRLAQERRHVTMLGRKTAQERLADFLDEVARCLGCPPGYIDLPMTRQQVADYTGLTLETVSRIFSRWSREGRLRKIGPTSYARGDHPLPIAA